MAAEKYSGTVTRVRYSNSDRPWMAGDLALDDESAAKIGKKLLKFGGKCYAEEGDQLEVVGHWTTHPKWGKQFDVESGIVRMDESPEALVHLLATHSDFTGLGPVRAKAVVDAALHYGTGDIAQALIKEPGLVATRSGVSLDIVQNAAKVWGEKKDYFDALAALGEQGWSGAQSTRIVKCFGEGAPAILKSDPYMLIGKLSRFGFRTVDTVARKMGVESSDPMRLAAGAAYCLDRIAQNGNTWTTREGLLQEVFEELKPDSLNGEDLIRASIETMIVSGLIHVDHNPSGEEIVSDAALAAVEIEVFSRLLEGLADNMVRPMDMTSERSLAITQTLNSGQRSALAGFSSFLYSVLSGKAGTGKTFSIKAIAQISEENGLEVALCAPSGKAARKISHATNREAFTIHRLLQTMYDEETGNFRFTRNAANPLDADIVIVDEVSMVDVRLMLSLLSALAPGARLLLVGDHHQIPSVGPGAILRDLLSAQLRYPGAVHILTDIVRQAGVLARNTTAILDGLVVTEDCESWGIQRTDKGHEEDAAAMAAALVEALVTSPEPLAPFNRILDFSWDIQVLSPTRKGPLGTWALNVHLQKLRQRLLGNPAPAETKPGTSPKPLVGDRVIWTKNDYVLDLYNGTQAIVTSFPKGGAMELFTEDGREVTIPASKRNMVEVAYAMTVHKSQGSGWPMVILVGSSAHWIQHDRNLLYTGASRASESLTILGDISGIRHFAKEQRSARRQTLGGFLVHGWELNREAQPVGVAPNPDTRARHW